jgi:hypothetical protein
LKKKEKKKQFLEYARVDTPIIKTSTRMCRNSSIKNKAPFGEFDTAPVPSATYLVRAANQIQIEPVQELVQDILAEHVRDPAVVVAPAADVLVRVRPQHVAQDACVHIEQNETGGRVRPQHVAQDACTTHRAKGNRRERGEQGASEAWDCGENKGSHYWPSTFAT